MAEPFPSQEGLRGLAAHACLWASGGVSTSVTGGLCRACNVSTGLFQDGTWPECAQPNAFLKSALYPVIPPGFVEEGQGAWELSRAAVRDFH